MNSTSRSPRRDYIVAREVALLLFVGAFLGAACYALIASFMPAAASFAAIGLLLPYGLLILFRIAYRRRTGRGLVQVWAEFAEHREKQEKVRQEAATAGRLAKMKADPMVAAPSTISISLLNWAAVGLFLYAVALIGSQALYWLKTGQWLPISIGAVFMEQFEETRWPIEWREEWSYGQSITGERCLRFVNTTLVEIVDEPPIDRLAASTGPAS